MKAKNILFPMGAAALAAGSALAVKTAKLKKTLAPSAPAIAFTADEEEKYAHNLSEMVKIPTISRKEDESYEIFTAFQEKMAELFPITFATLERHELNGNLLLRWRGKTEGGGIMLMGHQDVVPVDQSGWEKDPFSGEISDGKIWGRGAMDCKSTVCCEFCAVEELLAEGFEPEKDIWLFASRNEENSGGGSERCSEYLEKLGIRLDMVMDEGGAVVDGVFPGLKTPCSAVGVVEKGFCDVKFIARGNGGHASTPSRHTPIARLADFVSEVDKKSPFKKEYNEPVPEMLAAVTPYLPFYLRLVTGNMNIFGGVLKKVLPLVSAEGGAFISTTAAFTMSGGSTASNVLPDEAYVICNIRPSVTQNAEESIDILRKIAAKHDVDTEVLMARDASPVSPTNSEEFKYLTRCINECLPDTIALPYLMTGGTDSRQFYNICDNVLRFTPTRLTGEQLAAMHAANENIDTAALAEGVKFYKYMIANRK